MIDIGSNSVRLVVYEAAHRSPTPLFNEKVLCGLGRALATTGMLNEAGVERAMGALRRFRAISDQLGVDTVRVVATAAVREADNGRHFVERAERVCRAPIEVLSGEQEAQLAAAGVIAGLHDVDGFGADLGGGSLEIVDIKGKDIVGGATLPLGTLRLIDVSGGSLSKAKVYVDEQLSSLGWLEAGKGRTFYVVGGTWRAFARLHMEHTNYPLSVMHGYSLDVGEALTFANLLDRLSPNSLAGIKAVSKARRETLPFGSLILERLLRRVRPRKVVVSAFGLREGLLYRLLSADEQARDPLIAACEELAGLRARSLEHSRELVDWTDGLFATPGPEETARQRRLRRATCLVSDIGWRAHPDYRGEQSLNLIANAAFAGIDHPGRAFLALSIYYRNQGLDSDGTPGLGDLLDEESVRRARIIGAAVRAAHMLSAAMPGVIPSTPVTYEGGKLVLVIPDRLADLAGERLDRRFAVLARELNREPEIRVGSQSRRLAV